MPPTPENTEEEDIPVITYDDYFPLMANVLVSLHGSLNSWEEVWKAYEKYGFKKQMVKMYAQIQDENYCGMNLELIFTNLANDIKDDCGE